MERKEEKELKTKEILKALKEVEKITGKPPAVEALEQYLAICRLKRLLDDPSITLKK